MTAYRMKHVPTGLYYCPSREVKVSWPNTGSVYVKSNLSKRGKVYLTRPTLKWVGKQFYDHRIPVVERYGRTKIMSPFIPDDWAIEEIT